MSSHKAVGHIGSPVPNVPVTGYLRTWTQTTSSHKAVRYTAVSLHLAI